MIKKLDLIELSDRFRRAGAPLPVDRDVAEKLVSAARVFAVRLSNYYPEYGMKADLNRQHLKDLEASVHEIMALLSQTDFRSVKLPLNSEYPDAKSMLRSWRTQIKSEGNKRQRISLQRAGSAYKLDLFAQGYPIRPEINTILDEGYTGGFSVDSNLKSRWRWEEDQEKKMLDWDEPA